METKEICARKTILRERYPARLATALAALLLCAAASPPAPDMTGRWRVAEGPDAAGELDLAANGRFEYEFAAGSLDERAAGRWERKGAAACLFTEPRPVAAAFSQAPLLAVDGMVPTVLVTWPDGKGIAGVDFRIGFDSGNPRQGYTQYYGWTMPGDDRRVPRWIELIEPTYGVRSPRYTLGPQDRGKLHVVLIPNDIGVVDFQGACLEPAANGAVLHRKEGDMRFVRASSQRGR